MATTLNLPYVYAPSPFEASVPHYDALGPITFFGACPYQPICWSEAHACEVIDISEVNNGPLQPLPIIPVISKENNCNSNGNYIEGTLIGYEYSGPSTSDRGFKKKNSNRKTKSMNKSSLTFSGSYQIR